MLKEMETENCTSVSVSGKRKPEFVLKLCNPRWLRNRLERFFSHNCTTRKRDVRDMWFGMSGMMFF